MRKLLIIVLFLLLLIPAVAYSSSYTVAGATSPSAANGDYTAAGDYGGLTYYKHNTENYYIFWKSDFSEWEIGTTAGGMPPLWVKVAPKEVITGSYGNITGSGTVTVSAAGPPPPPVARSRVIMISGD